MEGTTAAGDPDDRLVTAVIAACLVPWPAIGIAAAVGITGIGLIVTAFVAALATICAVMMDR